MAHFRELEWKFRAARPFRIHEGSGSRYRAQSQEELETTERLLEGIRNFTPPGRQRRGADQEIREQGSLVLAHSQCSKNKMAPVRAHNGSSNEDIRCPPRGTTKVSQPEGDNIETGRQKLCISILRPTS